MKWYFENRVSQLRLAEVMGSGQNYGDAYCLVANTDAELMSTAFRMVLTVSKS